jgi:hypothetical protein
MSPTIEFEDLTAQCPPRTSRLHRKELAGDALGVGRVRFDAGSVRRDQRWTTPSTARR